MITLIKLGGSLITDKRQVATFRSDVMTRLAREIKQGVDRNPDLKLIVGHGSGSFGHVTASRYNTMQGVHTDEEWRGFSSVAVSAATLSYHVMKIMGEVALPVWQFSPSASAIGENGIIRQMALEPIRTAIAHQLIPLVHGDVMVDTVRGGTIASTETVFTYLTDHLPVSRILLLGEVTGVLNPKGHLIPEITPQNFLDIRESLGGSDGIDVTGGMVTKVRDMLELVHAHPTIKVRILDGRVSNNLVDTLTGDAQPGTLIHNGTSDEQ